AEAEAQARAAEERAQAEAAARAQARQQAALEVARIEAESKARLAAEETHRAHELALIEARSRGGNRRLQQALCAALGLVLCVGAGLGYHLSSQVSELERQTAELQVSQREAAETHSRAMKATLSALERRQAVLSAKSEGSLPEQVRVAAQAASEASEQGRLDARRLGELREALDQWETRLAQSEKLAELDQRKADLDAWAKTQRRSELSAEASEAAEQARRSGASSGELLAYDEALDELGQALREGGSRRGAIRTGPRPPAEPERVCTNPHDPMCGLDGKPL
ncbi:MAG: hypothetical protein JRI23_19550, partial [Deltaproteobacteria bacterium]|nr:hypothetical protein [Deltaproteobacteria bacterium]MBW2534061.1 hypothetical protein [Deltaproteobacteria bacterium]